MPYLLSQVVSAVPLYSYSSGVYRTLIAIQFHAYGIVHDASGSAVRTLVSQNPASVTLTTLNHYAGGTLGANPANPSHLTVTTRNLVNCGTLTAA